MECSVYNCFNRAGGDNGITFHAFPQNIEKRKQWIKSVGRVIGEPDENSSVCSVHFDNASFILGSHPPILSEDAMPRSFTAQKAYSKIKSVKPKKKFQLKRKNNRVNKQIVKKTSLEMLYILLREKRLKDIIEREKKISRTRLTEIRRLKAENSMLSAQLSALSGVVRTVAWAKEAIRITINANDTNQENEAAESGSVSMLKNNFTR